MPWLKRRDDDNPEDPRRSEPARPPAPPRLRLSTAVPLIAAISLALWVALVLAFQAVPWAWRSLVADTQHSR